MSEIVKARPKILIYEAYDSLYKVLKAETLQGDEISLVGYFPNLVLELGYEFEGEYITSPKYGIQFKVKTFKRLDIDDKEGIVTYLSSELFKGIGTKTAEKIYDTLGPNALKKIIDDKDSLKAIKGFSEEKINDLYLSLIRNQNIEKIFVELYNYNLSPTMVNRLYNKYADKTLEFVKQNPYRLIYDVEGFGFIKADNLAISFGFSFHDEKRIEEGIIYTLTNVCQNNGFTFLTGVQLKNSAIALLNKTITSSDLITEDEIIKGLDKIISSSRIVKEDDRYYPKNLYDAEVVVSKKIIELNQITDKIFSVEFLNDKINVIEDNFNLSYTLSQKEAIINSINSKVSIITGGPGTGKTTIIKGILNILALTEGKVITDDKFRHKTLLIAPTGRAAKRLGASCGMQASTIHKALGYNYMNEFEYNEENLLPHNLIIIDEFSMVDIMLASALFKAIKSDARIIIVGDSNQLPSVSPGNVLHDMLDSKIITSSRLTEIMRQQSDSLIIKLSQDIIAQNVRRDLFRQKDKAELYFYDADANGALEKILIFVENFINKGGNLLTDLQILIPLYSGPCGIDIVNKKIQEKFNTSKEEIRYGEKIFKLLDKVLQLQNNPELGIMNGDIGYIKEITKTESMAFLTIDFDGYIVQYPASELENLTLAYAISIHKSQGSEYANVIMPIVKSYYVMLKKNLIYTAVTRAKNKLIIIGDFISFSDAAKRAVDVRQTTLMQRILNKKDIKVGVIYIDDPEIPFDTLGEMDMDGITPYSFMEKD